MNSQNSVRFGIGVPAGIEERLGGTYLDAASRWCQLAEGLGFDFVTLPHHRFTPGYRSGSPWVTLAALAARTERLHLGAGAPGERDDEASGALRKRQAASSDSTSSGLDALAAMVVAGSPDDVISGIRRYVAATACEHFIPAISGTDPVRSLELFGRHVIPAFR